ncbi:SDR family oxidoreductase [Neolewinella antarctica]|uniref:NAD(P)-dependent dehydrogenase (Short-subunit alcohol dehydrogenase family) n=1 Tax=Neolewinella antarctica TaxID=442734 RepID=A0ABX0XA69_9BACT|nr:SDR family oxidoreductase [Neolewinella antarctica]NJC26107.1 NAD(P)-dependent dehydrogenase (short-subunit alcohol dehydrogenase family) [Neolewinella antarctica]
MSKFISIENKVILITGAAGLIGKELCLAFLADGAQVVACDLNPAPLSDLGTGDRAQNVITLALDITVAEQREEAVRQAVEKFGRIDVLINSAAIDAKFDKGGTGKINNSRFENYPEAPLRQSVEVNMTATIQMTQVVCRQMVEQGHGNIINLASTYSLVAPNQGLYDFGGQISYKPIDYVATKSFIPNFTRYLATFYAKEGIRCNAVVPHGIENNHSDEFKERFAQYSPMARMCDRKELIGIFVYLASDASSYMTGSVIPVDGGWTAW